MYSTVHKYSICEKLMCNCIYTVHGLNFLLYVCTRMYSPQHMHLAQNILSSGTQFLDVPLFARGCVCSCIAAHIVCEVEKEVLSGEMCLEEHASRTILVVAVNSLYNRR